MKSYWSIPGPKESPLGLPCVAFEKFDGSNIRYEWIKKRGWYKFGTRNRLLDCTDPDFGPAIDLFLNKYGDAIPKVLADEKEYRGVRECIVFCEFFGKLSFAGFHEPSDPKDVVLLDVNPHKKGIIGPRQFVKHFGHLHIPRVVYEGNFNRSFIARVRHGEFKVEEGVVAKGNNPKGKPPHNLWMAKVKTQAWLEQLRKKAEYIEALKAVLADNEKEQEFVEGDTLLD